MFKDFMFNKVLYPLFRKQIDRKLNSIKTGFVKSFYVTEKGLTHVHVDKLYPLASKVTLYKETKPLYDPDTNEYLGMLEEEYASGYVTEIQSDCSHILLNNQKKSLELGLLSKLS